MIKSKDKKKTDLLLGAVLLLTATVLFLGGISSGKKGGAVQIMVADQDSGLSLSEDREILVGEGNILCISDGAAFMKGQTVRISFASIRERSRAKGRSLPAFQPVTVRVTGALLPEQTALPDENQAVRMQRKREYREMKEKKKRSPAFYGSRSAGTDRLMRSLWCPCRFPSRDPAWACQCGGAGSSGAFWLRGGISGVGGAYRTCWLSFWKSFCCFLDGRASKPCGDGASSEKWKIWLSRYQYGGRRFSQPRAASDRLSGSREFAAFFIIFRCFLGPEF
ncbi:MAG: hypothetical protein V8S22_04375 [Lachnospiraceae bacterium]